MKKVILFIIGIVFFGVNFSNANEYIVTQLTEILRKPTGEWFAVYYPKINDAGHIVWSGGYEITPYDNEIYMYFNNDVIQITNNLSDDWDPVINDIGGIAWMGGLNQPGETIFTYDGNTIFPIPGEYDNIYVSDIGNSGQIVWNATKSYYSSEIYYWDGTSTVNFPNNTYQDVRPLIYDSNKIVWLCQDPVSKNYQVCIYDGLNINKISDVLWNASSMECKGKYIVWSAYKNNTSEIFLFDGSKTTQITSDEFNANPRCNAKGQIVWVRSGINSSYGDEIMFFDGNSITQITNDIGVDAAPDINDDGTITWFGGYDGTNYDYEIYSYSNNTITQVTDNFVNDLYPKISNNGQIVWTGGHTGTMAVFLATPTNHIPVVSAGPNIYITSENQPYTILYGTALDDDGDSCQYRWMKEENELTQWQTVSVNGELYFNLAEVPFFNIGEHELTLQVTDGKVTVSDVMFLTVNNSMPHIAPTGAGTYNLWDAVTLGGEVSDFDGDSLSYQWFIGEDVACSGTIQSIVEGYPVSVPDCTVTGLPLGDHIAYLQVNDGFNDSVSSEVVVVRIIDDTAPNLAPLVSRSILWPPNHEMVDITIDAQAIDNSGQPVTLSAVVSSDEPQDGLGDGDTAPDWEEPWINQESGVITLKLRAERSGLDDGRCYTVTVTATDISGNSSTAVLNIIVPRDQGKK